MDKIAFWIITYKDISNIKPMVEKISEITNFPFSIQILDNTDDDPTILESLKAIETEYKEKGVDITIHTAGKNLYWSKGMNYLDENTEFTPYVIYLCSRHITINDISGFDDMINALKDNPKAAQSGRVARCAGLYYFKAQNAPYPPPPEKFLHTFPRFLPKLEGKFSRLEIFKGGRIYTHVQGGLFAFNRQILRDVTGYDEVLVHYYSDLEMGVRLQCYGYDLVNVPTIYSAITNIEVIPKGEFKIMHSYADQKVEGAETANERP
jgi:GT2 family glycosyltransferase